MQTRQIFALIVALASVLCLAACHEGAATPQPDTQAQARDLVARGEYLVRIGGCNDCHTQDYGARGGDIPTSQWLLGNREGFVGPWGTSYGTNLRLTVDRLDEAGWLAYTATLQARPLMPAYMLRQMHEEDRRAIYHFIRALGPAGTPAPAALQPGQTPAPPYLQLVLPTREAPAS